MSKSIIHSFSELLSILEFEKEKCALIVMFKSPTCPPCRQTMTYLTSLNSAGQMVWDQHATHFYQENAVKLYFMPIDASLSSMENNPKLFPILSAVQSVRGLPTFDFFTITNHYLHYIPKARYAGKLDRGSFDNYLHVCHDYLHG